MVGAGYIAVELAGILSSLGSDVSLLIRYDKVRSFFALVIWLQSSISTDVTINRLLTRYNRCRMNLFCASW